MYAEFLVASIGSLAYAEDDGRHILGIKVARSPASVRETATDIDGIGCHVLECENEVRNINTFPIVFPHSFSTYVERCS